MLSGYRIMWVMVMFDLPTNTKGERAAASNFRNDLKDLGFEMVQYSVYIRFCGSQSKADTTITAIQWRAGEHSAIHRQAVRGHPHLHGRAANRPENASRTARNVLGRSKFQFQKSQYPLRCRGYCIYEVYRPWICVLTGTGFSRGHLLGLATGSAQARAVPSEPASMLMLSR